MNCLKQVREYLGSLSFMCSKLYSNLILISLKEVPYISFKLKRSSCIVVKLIFLYFL